MNNSIKKGVVVAVILLFISVSVIPSTAQEKQDVTLLPLNYCSSIFPPKSGLYFVVPPIKNWLKHGIWFTAIELIKEWSNKPFTNTTLMYIGSGIGFRPFMNLTIRVYSYYPGNPSRVDVYSDGEYYDTIYSKWPGGPMSLRVYDLFYYEKGFHRLTFISGDNSSILDIDVQIGFRGFIKHILPYLII